MRRYPAFLLAAGLAACAGDPTAERPSPYLGDDPTPPRGALDPAALRAGASEAVAAAGRADVPAIVAFYEAMMARADDTCPTLSRDETATTASTFWYGDCTTAAGVSFSGYGSLSRYTGAITADGAIRDGVDGYMDAVITAPDGGRLDIGFYYLADTRERQGDTTTDLVMLQGTARASGPGSPDNPYLRGERPTTLTRQITAHDDGAREVYLDGAVSGLSGAQSAAAGAVFSGVYQRIPASGAPCADPLGTISLRQEGGGWYDVTFDAVDPETYAVDTQACDGCGDGYFEGAPIGAVCLDTAPIAALADGSP